MKRKRNPKIQKQKPKAFLQARSLLFSRIPVKNRASSLTKMMLRRALEVRKLGRQIV